MCIRDSYYPFHFYISSTFLQWIIMTTAIKRQGRHTHKIRVISGLIHVYFLRFARFLNGKCRNPYQYTACKPKKCPAWIAICFLWIAGPVSYTHLDVYKRQGLKICI